jgi:hypothetical protein
MDRIRMRKTIAILVSGKAGVGKSLSSEILENYTRERHGISVGTFHFAQSLKSIAKSMGWNGEKDLKGRALLQGIGQVGRAYNENTWVDLTINKEVEGHYLYPLDVILIDDWRFPNEFHFVSKCPLYEVIKLRIESPNREILKGTKEYDEVSENSLPVAQSYPGYYDYILFNEGTKEDLEEKLKVFWEFVLDFEKENIVCKH